MRERTDPCKFIIQVEAILAVQILSLRTFLLIVVVVVVVVFNLLLLLLFVIC